MAKVAVILSGCGVYDGSEIHESVMALFYLQHANFEIVYTAPNVDQFHVINHTSSEESSQPRNVLVESARIARGPVLDLSDANPEDFDAVVLPGGFGAAKNLCNFAIKGVEAEVQPDVERFLIKSHQLGKPIGAICISPVVLALIASRFQTQSKLNLTIGNDPATSEAIEKLGCEHSVKKVDEICVDEKNKIITTPAYMLGQNVVEIASGIEKLVQKLGTWIS
ncbi:isoprenoid biosynthesis glyoxalase ElbB [bacterium]|jgi:enhancing lycopene biosynthesis protein 2|nr:isoprenoid biosynthesis glyoxalase ElbB [bacterium]